VEGRFDWPRLATRLTRFSAPLRAIQNRDSAEFGIRRVSYLVWRSWQESAQVLGRGLNFEPIQDLSLSCGESGEMDNPLRTMMLDEHRIVPECSEDRQSRCPFLFDGRVGGEIATVGSLNQKM
jgi:hypothetical protein